MSRLRKDDSGQIHTIEGIVSALVVLVALTYIIGSITFVSPQTEKTTVMKLSIKAQDIMNVMSGQDQPGNFTSPLTRSIAEWDGGAASPTYEVNASEASIIALNDRIRSLLPEKIMYNMDISYIDEQASATLGRLVFNDTCIIFQGDPQENSVMASKLVVLNGYDINGSTNYWNGMTVPKTVEVKLILWSI